MRNLSKWLLPAGQLLFVSALLLTVFEWTALDGRYHMELHRAQGAAQATGLSDEGVARASDTLLRYLRGEAVDLAYTDQVYGEARRVFEDREVAHMRDVLGLFQAGRALRCWLLAGGLLLSAAGMMGLGGRGSPLWGDPRKWKALSWALLAASLCWAALLGLAALFAVFSFGRAFTLFHELLFTNALWMMDNSQLMIRMLPQPFFMALAGRAALLCGMTLAALTALGIWGTRRARKDNP
ncbi:DUF1461 domain-containing protein [Bacillota bacterium Meth-B3]